MDERDFVAALAETLKRHFPGVHIQRSVDRVTLGIPDLQAVRPNRRFLAVEAKRLQRLLIDPRLPGNRTGPLLDHAFTGPQISTLRSLVRAGAEAWGLVQVCRDAAFRVHPKDIPANGNFTHAELEACGVLINRTSEGWLFWDE